MCPKHAAAVNFIDGTIEGDLPNHCLGEGLWTTTCWRWWEALRAQGECIYANQVAYKWVLNGSRSLHLHEPGLCRADQVVYNKAQQQLGYTKTCTSLSHLFCTQQAGSSQG